MPVRRPRDKYYLWTAAGRVGRQRAKEKCPPPPRRPPAIHPCRAYPDLYPEAGPPMGAGLIHGNACALLVGFVRARLLDLGLARDSFAVGRNVYVYAYQRRASPDVCAYLHLDPARGNVGAFHVDFDGPPALVIEVLSRSTREKDVGLGDTLEDKKRFYADIGAVEYWIYDPETRRKDGGGILEGFRLAAGDYVRIAPQAGRWYSDVLQTHWDGRAPHVRPARRWYSDVLQTHWGIGMPFQAGPWTYAPLRLRKPGTLGWYPIAEELEEINAKLKKAQLGTRDGQNPKPSALVA